MKRKGIISIVLVTVAACAAVFFFTKFHSGNTSAKPATPKSIIRQTIIAVSVPKKPASTAVTPTASPPPQQINSCNNLLVLVDRSYGLPSTYIPSDLVQLNRYSIPVTSSSLMGRLIMIPDLERLFTDAKKENINLIVVSPYRSYTTQKAVYTAYVSQYGVTQANQFSAMPGHSQHQLGTAIDFSTASLHDQLDQSFGSTPAGEWLLRNAYKYGFYIAYPQGQESITGYEYEPWHLRYLGIQNARMLEQSGLNMEIYLQKYGVKPDC